MDETKGFERNGKTHNSQLGIKFVTFKQSERKSNQTNKKNLEKFNLEFNRKL